MKKGEYNLCRCQTCADSKDMGFEDFLKHLESVHGIKRGTSGTRSMIMHADGRDFSDWTYQWEIGDVKFIQTTRTMRAKDDMMRYA